MKMIVRLLLTLSLVSAAQAQVVDEVFRFIFGGATPIAGTVSYVQPNHFILVSGDNQFLRVFLKPGEIMPSSVVPGMIIQASVVEGDNQQIILESLDGVQSPTGQMMPLPAP